VASAAMLAAVMLNPLFTWITALVMTIYPPGQNMLVLEQTVSSILADAPGLWAILIVFALAPAVIEEITFRGFILSGMENLRNKWQAILLSSLIFGIAHGVIQQSMITFVVGAVLGLIALQTNSIIPCMLFHAVHNSLAVLLSSANRHAVETSLVLKHVLVTGDGGSYQYGLLPGILMSIAGILLLVYFLKPRQKPDQRSVAPQPLECAKLVAGR
jgi:sodium transport system permease protein